MNPMHPLYIEMSIAKITKFTCELCIFCIAVANDRFLMFVPNLHSLVRNEGGYLAHVGL